MNGFMNGIRKFMYGRYGLDQFTRALIVIALLLSVLGSFGRNPILVYGSYLPIAYALFRTFSKNITKRERENVLYCTVINSFKKFVINLKNLFFGTKTHKYYQCNHCKQTIRVPRGKGKICITCPKCKTEFVKKT